MPDSGGEFAETFMDEIRKEATTKGATKSTKLAHWAQYKARKAVRNLPKTALSGVLGRVPIVGSALSEGAGLATTAVRAKRIRAKAALYHTRVQISKHIEATDNVITDLLRKEAKAEAKDGKTVLTKIDSTMSKLNVARTECAAATGAHAAAIAAGNEPTIEQLVAVGRGIVKREHYEDKLLVLVGTLEGYLATVREFAERSAEETDLIEGNFLEDLAALEQGITAQLRAVTDKDGFHRLT